MHYGVLQNMPSTYTCENCNLHFCVGWFHFHTYIDGYGSVTLFACSSCGSEGQVEHAIKDRGNPDYGIYDVTVESVNSESRVRWLCALRKLKGLSLPQARNVLDSLPYKIASEVYEEGAADLVRDMGGNSLAKYSVDEVCRWPNELYGPIQKNTLKFSLSPRFTEEASVDEFVSSRPLGELVGINSVFDLKEQICHHCNASNTLFTDLKVEENEYCTCPNCKEKKLKYLTGFIT